MKMMGIPESDIASSWYMSFLLFHIFTAVGCGVVTKLFYAKSSIELLIIFWILSFTSLISMCSFLASFFTKATRATLVSLMFTFGGYFITLFVDFRIDASASVMASSLHPAAAFGFGLQEIGRLEDLDVGLIWNTLDETDSPSGFTFLNTLTMLLVDTVLYAVLAWYTNRVVPGEFGRPLPLHFPFTMAYWFPGRIAPSTSSDEVPVDSAVHSEPVSRNLKDQAKEGKSIEIRNLSKHFQEKIAVDGLNLSMYRGQCTALLGHNGAGESTIRFALERVILFAIACYSLLICLLPFYYRQNDHIEHAYRNDGANRWLRRCCGERYPDTNDTNPPRDWYLFAT